MAVPGACVHARVRACVFKWTSLCVLAPINRHNTGGLIGAAIQGSAFQGFLSGDLTVTHARAKERKGPGVTDRQAKAKHSEDML